MRLSRNTVDARALRAVAALAPFKVRDWAWQDMPDPDAVLIADKSPFTAVAAARDYAAEHSLGRVYHGSRVDGTPIAHVVGDSDQTLEAMLATVNDDPMYAVARRVTELAYWRIDGSYWTWLPGNTPRRARARYRRKVNDVWAVLDAVAACVTPKVAELDASLGMWYQHFVVPADALAEISDAFGVVSTLRAELGQLGADAMAPATTRFGASPRTRMRASAHI